MLGRNWLSITIFLALLTGCTSAPSSGRYSIQQDRAPNRPVDVAAIPEVVPGPVQRTQAGNRSPYTVLGRTYHVLPTERGYRERGIASWYGEKFHGHLTSNGEVFDMYKASAAHKSLPIPSFVRVTNLDNNRSLIVRVNDRGPFHGDRLIDLSYAAAMKLGYAKPGTARVEVEAITTPAGQDRGLVRGPAAAPALRSVAAEFPATYLQVGAFTELGSARRLSAALEALTDRPVFIRSVNLPSRGTVHRVRVGPLRDEAEIRRLSARVVAASLGSPYTVSE